MLPAPRCAGRWGRHAGSSWSRSCAVRSSKHLTEGSSPARPALSISKAITGDRKYFVDEATEGRGLKPP